MASQVVCDIEGCDRKEETSMGWCKPCAARILLSIPKDQNPWDSPLLTEADHQAYMRMVDRWGQMYAEVEDGTTEP